MENTNNFNSEKMSLEDRKRLISFEQNLKDINQMIKKIQNDFQNIMYPVSHTQAEPLCNLLVQYRNTLQNITDDISIMLNSTSETINSMKGE